MKYFAIVLSLILASCAGKSEEKTDKELDHEFSDSIEKVIDQKETLVETSKDVYSVRTTFEPENGWGYQILNNGELYINQPHIPAVAGNKGFDSENKATITADYIIYKMNNGLFPPTVSPEELDSLGVM